MNIRSTITLILLLILQSCISPPKYIVISPELFGYTKDIYKDKSIQLNVVDQRSYSHVVQILKDDKPATFFSSQDLLTNIVKQTLIPMYNKQGIQVTELSPIKVDVYINDALITVNQNFVDYHATNAIKLTISVLSDENPVSKTFSSKGRSHGPLNADMAVLERDFNHQLAKLLINIANNADIQNTINASEPSSNEI